MKARQKGFTLVEIAIVLVIIGLLLGGILKGQEMITQAKIALGSGGLAGKGWAQGTQSGLRFLPEYQTDFVFSALGEQWGLVGTTVLLVV